MSEKHLEKYPISGKSKSKQPQDILICYSQEFMKVTLVKTPSSVEYGTWTEDLLWLGKASSGGIVYQSNNKTFDLQFVLPIRSTKVRVLIKRHWSSIIAEYHYKLLHWFFFCRGVTEPKATIRYLYGSVLCPLHLSYGC